MIPRAPLRNGIKQNKTKTRPTNIRESSNETKQQSKWRPKWNASVSHPAHHPGHAADPSPKWVLVAARAGTGSPHHCRFHRPECAFDGQQQTRCINVAVLCTDSRIFIIQYYTYYSIVTIQPCSYLQRPERAQRRSLFVYIEHAMVILLIKKKYKDGPNPNARIENYCIHIYLSAVRCARSVRT